VLGTGSHGTVVLAGRLGRRRVAVKRMLRSLGEHAAREVRALVACDAHPNVLRFYLREARGPIIPALAPALAPAPARISPQHSPNPNQVRGPFVYLALELAHMTLQAR